LETALELMISEELAISATDAARDIVPARMKKDTINLSFIVSPANFPNLLTISSVSI
jgi:hypothetical protein